MSCKVRVGVIRRPPAPFRDPESRHSAGNWEGGEGGEGMLECAVYMRGPAVSSATLAGEGVGAKGRGGGGGAATRSRQNRLSHTRHRRSARTESTQMQGRLDLNQSPRSRDRCGPREYRLHRWAELTDPARRKAQRRGPRDRRQIRQYHRGSADPPPLQSRAALRFWSVEESRSRAGLSETHIAGKVMPSGVTSAHTS